MLQDAAGMTVHSMVTTGPGAATELMAQLDLAAVDLLLFVGGDGTVYEGLQVRHLSTASVSTAQHWVAACQGRQCVNEAAAAACSTAGLPSVQWCCRFGLCNCMLSGTQCVYQML